VADPVSPEDRFTELASRYLDGAANEAEVSELTGMVRGNPERRKVLARLFLQHGSLAWVLREAAKGGSVATSVPGLGEPTPGRRRWPAWILIPLAASLVITALIIRYAPPFQNDAENIAPAPAATSPRTVAFQDGVSPTTSYAGTRDARISDKDPSENRGADPILEVEGSPEAGGRPTLLQWDLREIPAGTRILSVEIGITVTSVSRDRAYEAYAVTQPWNESEVTWLEYADGRRWELPGGKGPRDHAAVPLLRFTPRRGTQSMALTGPGIEAVQSWVDRPESNHGMILLTTDRSGEFYAHSREWDVATARPKLTVTYRPRAN